MSIKHMNLALDTTYQPTTKIILLVLADYADENGECFPSWTKIMQRASVKNRHTVARHLKILEEDGVITRERRFDNSNIYRLFLSDAPSTKNVPGISNDTRVVIPDNTRVVISRSTLTTNKPPHNHQEVSLIPEWIDVTAWNEWETHRKEIKKKLTKSTRDKQLKFLSKHKENHREIIEQSIMNGWAGLFAIKNKSQRAQGVENINLYTGGIYQ